MCFYLTTHVRVYLYFVISRPFVLFSITYFGSRWKDKFILLVPLIYMEHCFKFNEYNQIENNHRRNSKKPLIRILNLCQICNVICRFKTLTSMQGRHFWPVNVKLTTVSTLKDEYIYPWWFPLSYWSYVHCVRINIRLMICTKMREIVHKLSRAYK